MKLEMPVKKAFMYFTAVPLPNQNKGGRFWLKKHPHVKSDHHHHKQHHQPSLLGQPQTSTFKVKDNTTRGDDNAKLIAAELELERHGDVPISPRNNHKAALATGVQNAGTDGDTQEHKPNIDNEINTTETKIQPLQGYMPTRRFCDSYVKARHNLSEQKKESYNHWRLVQIGSHDKEEMQGFWMGPDPGHDYNNRVKDALEREERRERHSLESCGCKQGTSNSQTCQECQKNSRQNCEQSALSLSGSAGSLKKPIDQANSGTIDNHRNEIETWRNAIISSTRHNGRPFCDHSSNAGCSKMVRSCEGSGVGPDTDDSSVPSLRELARYQLLMYQKCISGNDDNMEMTQYSYCCKRGACRKESGLVVQRRNDFRSRGDIPAEGCVKYGICNNPRADGGREKPNDWWETEGNPGGDSGRQTNLEKPCIFVGTEKKALLRGIKVARWIQAQGQVNCYYM